MLRCERPVLYRTQFLTFLYDAFSSKENVVSDRNVHIYADLGKISKTDLEHGSLKPSNLIGQLAWSKT